MKAIAAALANARREFGRAEKDGKNPLLKNRYPTLNSIVEACDEPLDRHGLTYWQPVVVLPSGMSVVRTVLCHVESGETLECDVPLSHEMGNKGVNPMQAMGSAITYARRYGLESLLGLMREDDDGNGSYAPRQNGHHHQPAPVRPQQPAATKPAISFDAWLAARARDFDASANDLRVELFDLACRNGWTTSKLPGDQWAGMFESTFESHREAYREWAKSKAVPA